MPILIVIALASPRLIAKSLALYLRLSTACTVAATFSSVKPKVLEQHRRRGRLAVGVDADHGGAAVFPPAVGLPISTAMRGMPVGQHGFLVLDLWRSNVVVLGMETTRTAIFFAASSAAPSAPVAPRSRWQ
jgi:hypothetical protein